MEMNEKKKKMIKLQFYENFCISDNQWSKGGVEKFEYRSTNFYVSRLFRFQTISFSEYAVVFDTRAIVCFRG